MDNDGTQQKFGVQTARTKRTEFSLNVPDGRSITFRYNTQTLEFNDDIKSIVQMSATSEGNEELTGVLWGNESYDSDYILNFPLLSSIKQVLSTSFTNKQLVVFLVTIAETESNGAGMSNIMKEIEAMEICRLFNELSEGDVCYKTF